MKLEEQLVKWHRGESSTEEIWEVCEWLKIWLGPKANDLASQFPCELPCRMPDEKEDNQDQIIWSDTADHALFATLEDLGMLMNPEINPFTSKDGLQVKKYKNISFERIKFLPQLTDRQWITERQVLKWPGDVFVVGDLKKAACFFHQLDKSKIRPWPWLRDRSLTEIKQDIRDIAAKSYVTREMQVRVIHWLNNIISKERLDQEPAFAPRKKSTTTSEKKKVNPRVDLPSDPSPQDIIDSNRRILGELLNAYLSNLEYLGEDNFKMLYAKIWLRRFMDAMRHQYGMGPGVQKDSTVIEEGMLDPDAKELEQEKPCKGYGKKSALNQHKSLATTRDPDSPRDPQCIYEDDLPATLPESPIRLDKRDIVFELVEALAVLTGYLNSINRQSLAKIADTQILFFKVCTIPCPSLKYSDKSKETPDDKMFRRIVSGLSTLTIESLWKDYHPEEIEVSEATLWHFVKKHLQLEQDAFYRRKHQYLLAIKEAPDALELSFWKNGTGRLWLREIGNWIGDLEKVQKRAELNKTILPVCQALAWYLRTMVASGHPSHVGKEQDRIQTISINNLIAINNPALVQLTTPSLQDFFEYIEEQNLLQKITMQRLIEALEQLKSSFQTMNPKPQRLFGLLGLLIEDVQATGLAKVNN